MSTLSETKLKRLRSSIAWSFRKLKPFREKRKEIIEQFVGMHYGDQGVSKPVPMNLLALALRIYQRSLVARNPRVMADSQYMQLKAVSYNLELACNHLIGKINLAASLRKVVQEALISVGIMKVAMQIGGSVEIEGGEYHVGQPYADAVTLEDWVHDMNAKTFDEISYAGNRYRLPMEMVKASTLYNKAVTSKLVSSSESDDDETGTGREDRADSLSKGTEEPEEFHEMVDLWDVWLPQENRILTLSARSDLPPIRDVEWSGPECGPFRILSFEDVPSNIIPKAPASDWLDIHITANKLLRKMIDDAENQKTILGYHAQAAKDAERVGKASNGEMVKMDFPEKAKEFTFRGVDGPSAAFFIQLKDLFSYNASNLETLGGLGAQAGTLGQEELLANSSNKQISEMQDRFVEFTGHVVRDLAWYMWDDPLIEIPIVKRVPGMENVQTVSKFTPESRSGDFLDYNINIQPYSMQHQTPELRFQAIRELIGEFIMPVLPMLQQQGLDLNWDALLRKIGHYRDIVDLEELIIFTGPPPYGAQPVQPPQVPKPAKTTRENVRINKSVGTRQGNDAALAQTFLAQGAGHAGMQGGR